MDLKNWTAFLIALAVGVIGFYLFTTPYVPAPEEELRKAHTCAPATQISGSRER